MEISTGQSNSTGMGFGAPRCFSFFWVCILQEHMSARERMDPFPTTTPLGTLSLPRYPLTPLVCMEVYLT